MKTKLLKRTALICLLFSLVSASSYAQTNFVPGYVVSLKQDTLKGLVDYRGAIRNSKQIVFQDQNGVEQKYTAEELKAYGVEGNDYRSFSIPVASKLSKEKEEETKSYFFKVLESGKVDLLYLRDEHDNDRYFITKDKVTIQELTNNYTIREQDGVKRRLYDSKYLAALRLNLTGCDRIDNLAIKVDFKEQPIRELIQKYNDCSNPREEVVTKMDRTLRIKPELYVGYSMSKVKAFGYRGYAYFVPIEGVSSPVLSAVFNFSSERINKAFSLNVGFDYIQKGAVCDMNRFLDFHYVDLRLFPAYTWPVGNFRPVVAGGLLYGKRVNRIEKAMTYIDSNGERQRFHVVDPKAEMGYVAEVGANYYPKKGAGNSINLRLGFSWTLMNFNMDNQAYHNQTSYLKIGYGF